MLALSLSDKFCCFGIFVFNFFVSVLNRFLFSRFSFHHFFVLVFVNEFVIFSFFAIFVFVNENHTAIHRRVSLLRAASFGNRRFLGSDARRISKFFAIGMKSVTQCN